MQKRFIMMIALVAVVLGCNNPGDGGGTTTSTSSTADSTSSGMGGADSTSSVGGSSSPSSVGGACNVASTGTSGAGGSSTSSTGGGVNDGHCDEEFVQITSAADVAKLADCTHLNEVYVHHIGMGGEKIILSFPVLESISKVFYVEQSPGIVGAFLPSLKTLSDSMGAGYGGVLYLNKNDSLRYFNAPNLNTIGDYIYVAGNPELVMFEVPSLTSVGATNISGDYTYIGNNQKLCVQPDAATWEAFTAGSVTISGNSTCCL